MHKGGYVQRHSDLLALPFVAITIVAITIVVGISA